MKKTIVVALTGASGIKIGDYFLKKVYDFKDLFDRVFVVISKNAFYVAESEGFKLDIDFYRNNFILEEEKNLASPIASGSYRFDGMVIVPCSMSSLGAIANGSGTNLIHRAADVCMKERRKLIIVPRETPFSYIHLENMRKLSLAGAHIVPFIPSFYNKPESIDDMLDFFSLRLFDLLGFSIKDNKRWGVDE